MNIVNDVYVKPKNKKLKENEYVDLFFGYFGNTLADSNGSLADFQSTKDYKNYPEFERTKEIVSKFFEVSQDVTKTLSKLLSRSNTYDKEDFHDLIVKLLNKHNIG